MREVVKEAVKDEQEREATRDEQGYGHGKVWPIDSRIPFLQPGYS